MDWEEIKNLQVHYFHQIADPKLWSTLLPYTGKLVPTSIEAG